MSYIASGLALISVAGSVAGNAQAGANAEAQAIQAYDNMNLKIGNLQNTANELNKQTGMELTNAKFQEMEALSTVASNRVESGVVGNTANRISNSVAIKGVQFKNQIKQRAEANTLKIQSDMKNAVNEYQSSIIGVATNYENSTDSGFGMLAKGATSYFGAGGTI